MSDTKLRISHDELYGSRIDERLKQQDAMLRTQQHSQQQVNPPFPAAVTGQSTSLRRNAVVYMTFFGLLGGVLAWAGAEVVWNVVPDPLSEWARMASAMNEIAVAAEDGRITAEEADARYQVIAAAGKDNPYMKIWTDENTPTDERLSAIKRMAKRDESRSVIALVVLMGWCGALLAMFLAMAEPVVSRNLQAAISNAATGALLGLVGGVGVSFVVGYIYSGLGGGLTTEGGLGQQLLARSATWGALGLFLCLAPGIVMRSVKKLCIGLMGGLVGGLIGGLLFDPINLLGYSDTVSRLVGIVAIGAVAGGCTGLIENAAKTGWLRVVAGLIAGKQFIVYRNPTSIGSSPQCEVYLFKDPQIAPRHAAVHVVPGGYEIEDLGGPGGTFVNGQAIGRTRLRNGDQVQIGSTCFVFQEKERSA